MENPSSWKRLTASLAVVGLKDEDKAWEFIRDEGLVRDEPGNRERFCEVVREVRENAIPGPSYAARVTFQIQQMGMVVEELAAEPDPAGEKAQVRLKQWQAHASRHS